MKSRRVSSLFRALFLLLAVLSRPINSARSPAKSVNPKDYILSVCRRAKYLDVCLSTLQAVSDKRCTDNKSLVLISLNACISHAEDTLAHAQQLMNSSAATSAGDDENYVKQCLEDCLSLYSDAVDELRESLAEATNGAYDSVNAKVSAAMTDSESCDDGFAERPGLASPLAERNAYFSKLCSNTLALAQLLS